MAHPQYQYLPRAYSPPRSTPSPHPGPYPPAKRQRLSPNSQSPYTSPSISNGALPNQVFSSPHFGAQPNGYQAHSYGNPTNHTSQVSQYQQPQAGGAMGPPSRPVDNKPTDVNDLSDVLVGSGVDLREEEAALFNSYNASGNQQNSTSFNQDSSASFGHASSGGSQSSNFKPYNRIDTLSSNVPGDRGSLHGAGTLNQPAIPLKTAEAQYEVQKKRARQRKNERQQYHLNDPFLHNGVVRKRLDKQAQIDHVVVQRDGLLTASGKEQPTELLVTGPDRNEFLTMVKGQDLLSSSSPLAEIFALISLAAQERLRAVVEDAAALAKGRRLGSHGVVPTELADLAVGNDQALLLTPGNSAVSPMTNPLTRSFSDAHKLPTPISDGATTPSTSLPNQTVQVLRTTITGDRSSDEERASKRSKRAANSILAGEPSRSNSFSIGTPGSGTQGTLGERAPEPEVITKKGTKKDQKKQADKVTELQQHAATTQTANMQLGLGGRKKPSWMVSARDTASPSLFPVPSRVNTNLSSQNKSSNAGGVSGAGGSSLGKRQIGDFREDKETGKGIQMRDVIMVLDPEPKEKKALARAYSKIAGRR